MQDAAPEPPSLRQARLNQLRASLRYGYCPVLGIGTPPRAGAIQIPVRLPKQEGGIDDKLIEFGLAVAEGPYIRATTCAPRNEASGVAARGR